MGTFYECINCKKDGISIPLKIVEGNQYCCSMCDSRYEVIEEETN